MKYYPVNLDIKDRQCIVVGGGDVGTRKVLTLLECSAFVTVVSPVASNTLLNLADRGSITLKKRSYVESDLHGMFLVICATDNDMLNRQVSVDAQKLNMLCNVADRPEACNFILPAVVKRGDLTIAVSTSGKSPAFAKKIRKDLEKQYGDEYAQFLKLMGAIREKLLNTKHEPEAHKHLFEELIDRDIIQMIRNGNVDKLNSALFEVLGKGYDFYDLIKQEEL
ncbi:MAG: bifunctional precorrin-2 dehydrogenase/sirohydrochlorin ferrochelatase [Proteobacteria bacterium]|nr:bifunctional precorrin-2 dehydrogenase/sirohydrochlorin ferrochelatase [Pseudomonadota bacterium]MBU4009953.1 bifunctional precorrin-2 dehydrogenase/sirohydrochlorin ferrochelatase [Pseudomonadota bacterium]MBU4035311.1 bifunctional precorrin-2 dehydrogenase/sirohydrochlorin ferrochelatase [Pseudomonadota bacterium]